MAVETDISPSGATTIYASYHSLRPDLPLPPRPTTSAARPTTFCGTHHQRGETYHFLRDPPLSAGPTTSCGTYHCCGSGRALRACRPDARAPATRWSRPPLL